VHCKFSPAHHDLTATRAKATHTVGSASESLACEQGLATSRGRSPQPHPYTAAMSVLPAEVHTALAALLSGLQSPDNVQRTTAEQQLNEEWVAQRPEVLLMGLSEQIELAQDTSVSLQRFVEAFGGD
jgi:hypothetical protein